MVLLRKNLEECLENEVQFWAHKLQLHLEKHNVERHGAYPARG